MVFLLFYLYANEASQSYFFQGMPITCPASMVRDVAAVYEAGIVSGVSKDQFAPNQPVTREQMAAMTVKALEVKTGKIFLPPSRLLLKTKSKLIW